jgi:hypothetical protein
MSLSLMSGDERGRLSIISMEGRPHPSVFVIRLEMGDLKFEAPFLSANSSESNIIKFFSKVQAKLNDKSHTFLSDDEQLRITLAEESTDENMLQMTMACKYAGPYDEVSFKLDMVGYKGQCHSRFEMGGIAVTRDELRSALQRIDE